VEAASNSSWRSVIDSAQKNIVAAFHLHSGRWKIEPRWIAALARRRGIGCGGIVPVKMDGDRQTGTYEELNVLTRMPWRVAAKSPKLPSST
jgi:hypothetical protein